jgi:hypothetical protein
MKLTYKIIITLVTILHLVFSVMGIFMPETIAKDFGFEYSDAMQKVCVHMGLFALIFSGFLSVATYWTFKGKREGILLGLVAGGGMLLAAILDFALVTDSGDLPLLIMALITIISAYLALKAHDASTD